MGLFDKLRGRTPAPPPPPVDDDAAPGWDAINAALARVYPGQEPKHLANAGVRWAFDLSGQANPLDGAHIFDAGDFWHYIGLGFTELYLKESDDPEYSGLGYELTFRLRKVPGMAMPPTWPVDLMNGLGRPAMLGQIALDVNHTVQTGPLAPDGDSARYVGVLLHADPDLPEIDTPHGKVKFLQIVPVEAADFERSRGGNAHVVLADLAQRDPRFVTEIDDGGGPE